MVNPSASAQTQSFKLPSKFSIGDLIKLVILLGSLIAGWYRLEQGLGEIRLEQKFDKERMAKIEETSAASASDLTKRLDKIDDKLDRLIERRGER